ncbi:DUF6396 domain-containing protein [Proteus vulgaris]|uniref:DUF6396 domain-containing protein n=1 Tax=Proteus vulgaris TaxID=585 RepID=UPI0021B13966|nr:DUF6396 domain-containing protein [Proteus vulgaris]MCT6518981.1 DUF6396 domain-containing protein [Proteus vulgaris]
MTTNSTLSKTPQIINMVPMKGAFSVLTNQWFITSEYAAYAAGFAPLINGERAFKAIALAIKQAKKSINIVIWGFQASMYFTRGKNGKERVGDLLRDAAERGVKVPDIDKIAPLPPTPLPEWDGTFEYQKQAQNQ